MCVSMLCLYLYRDKRRGKSFGLAQTKPKGIRGRAE